MAVFEFRELKQEANETLHEFYWRLRTKVSDCNFHSIDGKIRMQIIHKIKDKRLLRQALWESFPLQQLLTHGTSLEPTDEQAKKLEADSSHMPELPLNTLHNKSNQSHFRKDRPCFLGKGANGSCNNQ